MPAKNHAKQPALPSPKEARAASGLRQVDVASRAGVGLQTVIRCEKSGKYPRSIPNRAAYLAVFGIVERAAS